MFLILDTFKNSSRRFCENNKINDKIGKIGKINEINEFNEINDGLDSLLWQKSGKFIIALERNGPKTAKKSKTIIFGQNLFS